MIHVQVRIRHLQLSDAKHLQDTQDDQSPTPPSQFDR